MKKILVTGANSYIGMSFENYVSDDKDFQIDTIDMIDGSWREYDFSNYDVIFHVAGIAHADVGNVSEERKQLYYKVNTDLAIEVAKKAKAESVKQFIFMSSMIVYGGCEEKCITASTQPKPENFYGDSKWQADKGVQELNDDSFKVVVLRPPMIYGKNSKGNYPVLAKMATKLPVFPVVNNQRSMLYVGNLCEFIKQMIENEESGVFFPQNDEYTHTSLMVKEIAKVKGHKILMLHGFNWTISLMKKIGGKIGRLANKAFGDSYYEMSLSEYKTDYRKFSLQESIELTERDDDSKKALMLASVASMIDLFNADNIDILIEQGYKVDVSTNFDSGSITSQDRVDEYKQELINRGIGVYNTPIPRSISKVVDMLKSYRIVKRISLENKYQIVHCHSPIGGVICRLACRKARKKFGTKVIYTAHGFHFFDGASKNAWLIFYPIEKLCSRFTDVIITINQEDYKRAKKFHAMDVKYIPGIGVHTQEFRNIIIDKKFMREELGFDEDDFIIMSTGQISVRKNHEVIIQALSKITDSKVKYLIVGFGELEEKLKQLVNELGLEKRVVFAGYRGDVKKLLHSVDVFAFPSLQEGLPVSLMEAMCVGLPVVASKIRGNVDLVADGKNGFLVDKYDVDGFAKAINDFVNNSDLRFNFGKEASKTIDDYSNVVVIESMKKLYSSVGR